MAIRVIYDLIQLAGDIPVAGETLTLGKGGLLAIVEPVTFTTALDNQVATGDTAVIGGVTYTVTTVSLGVNNYTISDGVTYTVTSTQGGTGDFTHKNAGVDEIVSIKLGIITLENGSESSITYIIPIDDAGNIPDISQIEITFIGANDFFLTATNTDTNDLVTLLCFASGTRIEAVDGHMLVEDLAVGQVVETMDHGLQPIRWTDRSRFAAHGNHAPIVIKKDALGNARDLRVSPQHRILIQGWQPELLFGHTGVLVAAKHLVNDDTIYIEEGGVVTITISSSINMK